MIIPGPPTLATLLLCLVAPPEGPDTAADAGRLAMTRAVVCSQITGYRDFETRPDATLTADDKLFIYYEPLHYTTRREGPTYRAHFTQDARIHPRGQERVLSRKDGILDLKAESPSPPTTIYLGNTIALKGLPPGDYDLEIILHDRLSDGPPAKQVVPFTIKSAQAP